MTANQGFGSFWLTSHLKEFLDLYPEIKIDLLVLDAELDLSMREADVAIRLTPPSKPDLIQKKLRTAHTHLYASPDLSGDIACRWRQSMISTGTV